MGAVVGRQTFSATGNYLIARAGEGYGQGGWQIAVVGSGWTGSALLKNPTSAPGGTLALGSAKTYYLVTDGSSSAAALTTDANVIVQDTGSDLYFAYTHTAGTVTVTVMAAGELIGAEEGLLPVLNPVFTGTLTGPAITLSSGTLTGYDASFAKTLIGTTNTTQRLVLSQITLTPTSTTSVTAGGSLAAVRGAITLTAGKSFTDGFLYGAQGKVTLSGTMAEVSAARIAGVLGQVDLASGTVTAGQVSAVWADIQATAPTLTVPDQINILRATNSSSSTINAVLFAYGKATYFATFGADGGAPAYFVTTAPSGLAKSLKVVVQGTPYYIPLYSAAS